MPATRSRTPANRRSAAPTIDLTGPSPPLPAPTTSRRTRSQTASATRSPSVSVQAGGSRQLDVIDEEQRRPKKPRTRAEARRESQAGPSNNNEVIEVLDSPEIARPRRRAPSVRRAVAPPAAPAPLNGLHLPLGGVVGIEEGRRRREEQGLTPLLRPHSPPKPPSRPSSPLAGPVAGPSQPRSRKVKREPASSAATPSLSRASSPSSLRSSPSVPLAGPSSPQPPQASDAPLAIMSSYACPICFSPPNHATITPCGHVMCGSCLYASVRANLERAMVAGAAAAGQDVSPACPVCRAKLGLKGSAFLGDNAVGMMGQEVTEL